ncbi:hypothetical protein ABW19_dt0200888 [Dactylella cylindrospora]|nr:hypothetical protein ABW19_dt0200888 [Dactylella cylindrospora]
MQARKRPHIDTDSDCELQPLRKRYKGAVDPFSQVRMACNKHLIDSAYAGVRTTLPASIAAIVDFNAGKENARRDIDFADRMIWEITEKMRKFQEHDPEEGAIRAYIKKLEDKIAANQHSIILGQRNLARDPLSLGQKAVEKVWAFFGGGGLFKSIKERENAWKIYTRRNIEQEKREIENARIVISKMERELRGNTERRTKRLEKMNENKGRWQGNRRMAERRYFVLELFDIEWRERCSKGGDPPGWGEDISVGAWVDKYDKSVL